MRLLWDNKVDSGTITANSEASNYPVSNIVHIHLSRQWRSTGDTSEWIKIDAGAGNTITADSVAILQHNISSGATVKIQANATDVWTAPSIDETITYNSGIIFKFFTNTTGYRYWRLLVEDPSNPDGYIEIGRLFLCTYYQVEKSFQKAFTEEKTNTDQLSYSLSGQLYADIGIEFKRYALTFPYWNNTAKQAIETMVTMIGKHKPLVLFLDENNTDKLLPVYCHIESDIKYSHIHNYIWQGAVTFQEVF